MELNRRVGSLTRFVKAALPCPYLSLPQRTGSLLHSEPSPCGPSSLGVFLHSKSDNTQQACSLTRSPFSPRHSTLADQIWKKPLSVTKCGEKGNKGIVAFPLPALFSPPVVKLVAFIFLCESTTTRSISEFVVDIPHWPLDPATLLCWT
jgi:hypothetical protein